MNKQLPYSRGAKARRKANIELVIGLIVGILTPIFGVAVLLSEYPNVAQVEEITPGSVNYLMVRLFTFAIIINAAVFFLGLRFDREPLSRGVLFATILVAIVVLYLKFFA